MDIARSGEQILAAARALVPEVETRAAEIASLRRLPTDLVAKLKLAGVFRMPMPRAWGGPEMTPRAQTEVIEVLSAADPSVGWCVMIGSDAGFYGAFLDEGRAAGASQDECPHASSDPARRHLRPAPLRELRHPPVRGTLLQPPEVHRARRSG